MKNTIRVAALIGGIMLVAAVGLSALAAGGGSQTPVASTSPSDGDDFKGPCDEAEHANDPECQGVTLEPEDDVDDGVQAGDDVSGPCDEAEHANDPECQAGFVDDDNSGPGSGDDDAEDNSGPGSGDDDVDNSGPSENSGPGDADDDDDNSGPGSGDDDDNSGPGSGDDD